MLDYIAQLLKDFLAALGSWVWSFFTEFFTWIREQVIGLIQSIISSCGLDSSGMWAHEFFAKLNFFFPVTETFGILYILLVAWLAVLTLKIILKLVPTVY